MSLKYTLVTLCLISLSLSLSFRNHAPLNYSGQGSKNNLQFMILKNL